MLLFILSYIIIATVVQRSPVFHTNTTRPCVALGERGVKLIHSKP